MQVKEIMTNEVMFCGPNATLADVATAMWNKDCGAIPVVNQDKKVIGIITDRDVCMAVVMRNRLASGITANELIGGLVRVCSPEDDVETALEIMEHAQLRRLPVVAKDGTLCGIFSISDAIRQTGKDEKKNKRVPRKSVLKTLRSICKSRATEEVSEEIEKTNETSTTKTTEQTETVLQGSKIETKED
jgi:CBS domain-containing protein